MIITLIVFAITLSLFIFSVVFKEKIERNLDFEFGLLMSKLFSIAILILVSICIIVENCPLSSRTINIEYNERYNTIMAAIEEEDNDSILLTSEISDYNEDVLLGREYHNNPWVSWFCNGAYKDLPLIEIDNKEE